MPAILKPVTLTEMQDKYNEQRHITSLTISGQQGKFTP